MISSFGSPRTYRPRLTGEARRGQARAFAREYEAGATIRGLCAESGLSYGTVRQLLIEEEVTFRSRGGRLPKPAAGVRARARR